MRAYLLYVASATCMTARHFPKHGILERGKLQAPVMYAQLLHASIFRTSNGCPGIRSECCPVRSRKSMQAALRGELRARQLWTAFAILLTTFLHAEGSQRS